MIRQHQPRETVENLVESLNRNHTDYLKMLSEINVQILLDIRDLLVMLTQVSNVPKWGPKI